MAPYGSDRELVDRLADGEAAAWDELVHRNIDLLYRTVARVISPAPDGDVQDVVQAVFLKLWEDDRRRLRSWRGESRLSTWLVAVARREALTHLQRRRRERERAEPLVSRNGTCPPRHLEALVPGPHETLEAAEASQRLREALVELATRDELLVRLVYFDEASYKDAARALGVPLNSISPWLGRARRRLREILRGLGPEGRSSVPSDTRKDAP